MPSNDYSGISANVFARYDASDSVQYFAGIGQASRVPDARELYFKGAMISGAMVMAPLWGTPTLDETQNTEIDFGVDNRYDDFNIKTKLFYSQLKNYIYYNSSVISNKFENIDATIYGLEISGSYFVMDEAYLDFGLAYQKGEKDQALAGQSDKDLAEIPPMKINLALNYDYSHKNTARIEVLSVADWRNFDADNGEQSMPAYTVVNMKVRHDIMPDIELSLGIDNVFDKSYATTNTYKDLTLLADGSGDVMLINEPARYLYANVSYKF